MHFWMMIRRRYGILLMLCAKGGMCVCVRACERISYIIIMLVDLKPVEMLSEWFGEVYVGVGVHRGARRYRQSCPKDK